MSVARPGAPAGTPRPIVLGIVGDSAAGKTTLTKGLVELLGPDRVTHVCIDDYHRFDRSERSALGITPLNPACNHLDIIELHLERLHYGQSILKPVYDHATGRIVRPEYVQPREFVIVEGLLGFHTQVMRQFYDVKVYLDPPEPLRTFWKVRRDTTKRGYTTEQVTAELARREPDSEAYIRPQRDQADIAVRFMPPQGRSPEEAGPRLNVRLTLRPTIEHPDLSYLVEETADAPSSVRLARASGGSSSVQILEIEGEVTPEHAARLEEAIWQHLPELSSLPADRFGNYLDLSEVRHSDPLALTQLLLTCHLLRGKSRLIYAQPVAALSRLRVPLDRGSASHESATGPDVAPASEPARAPDVPPPSDSAPAPAFARPPRGQAGSGVPVGKSAASSLAARSRPAAADVETPAPLPSQ